MFKTILSLFGAKEEEITLETAFEILTNEKDEEPEATETQATVEENQYACTEKIGYITNINDDIYIIDGKYSFVSKYPYNQNAKVSFVLYNDEVNNTIVSNIRPVDDWTDADMKESLWHIRSLVCKVAAKNGRNLILSPHNLNINLDNSSTNFLPSIGDYLTVEAKCMIDEDVTDLTGKVLDIIKITPLRSQMLSGQIRHWDATKGEGIIGQNIFFKADALIGGYRPQVKDTVTTECIESDQGNCNWRSLHVVPSNEPSNEKMVKGIKFTKCETKVTVNKMVYLQIQEPNEPITFDIYVENESDSDVVLKRLQCVTNNVLKPSKPVANVTVPANEKIAIEFTFENRNAVNAFNIIKYSFDNFELITNVCVKQKRETFNLNHKNISNYDLVRGETVKGTPRFVSVRIPAYSVPQKLMDVIRTHAQRHKSNARIYKELIKLKPCLHMALSFNIYEDRFHTLLYLHEIRMLIDIEQYNMERARFVRDGDYLVLEVANLAERRPSLIIGDKIIAHDPKNQLLYEGIIHRVCSNHIYLKFSHRFHEIYNNEDYTVSAEVSRGVLKKMHYAITMAVRKLGREFLFPTKVNTKAPQIDFVYDKYVDDLGENSNDSITNDSSISDEDYKGTDSNEENIKPIKSPLRKMSNARLISLLKMNEQLQKTNRVSISNNGRLKLNWINQKLNYYQKEAVRNILIGSARPLPYIIFGPPGTGKTVTVIEIVLQIAKLMPHARILVATPSNSAADLITTRLIEFGTLKPGDLVRLIAQKLLTDNTIPCHLVPYCATIGIGTEGTTRSNETLKNGLRLGHDSSMIGLHRITIGTCAAIGSLLQCGLPKGHFTHIVVDEAGQATEPELMLALSLLDTSTGQVVLAGDPMQLGPVINSDTAIHYGLQESLLERLLTRFPYVRDVESFKDTAGYDPRLVTKLLYNYRCLPSALHLYNRLFYNSELKSTISVKDSPEAVLFDRIKSIRPNANDDDKDIVSSVVFHGIVGENFRTPDSPSWFNPEEASYVFDYINALYGMGLTQNDVGIITPYIKQVRYLRTLFMQAEFPSPKVGSVEEFQGQEYNVIILSVVRSESKHVKTDVAFNLGFVTNPRRVNVALSRAKCLTIILGNPYVLSTDSLWKEIIDDCKRNNAYCGCEI